LEIDSEEKNRYSIKKSRDELIFNKRKVENNAIEYRLQSIVPALGLKIDREKIDYRNKSIFDKRKVETNRLKEK